MNKAIFKSLKPGGYYIVIDHRAAKGAGPAVTETLHRMDEDIAKQEIESAGFKLVSEGKVLTNASDDDTKKVFEAGEHDHTDQFMLKFQKPRRTDDGTGGQRLGGGACVGHCRRRPAICRASGPGSSPLTASCLSCSPDGTTADADWIRVSVRPDTRYVSTQKARLADIKPGDFAGAVAIPEPGGALRAQEVHVYPGDLRGAGEGRIPQGSRLVINGTVAAADGKSLTLHYRGAAQNNGVCEGPRPRCRCAPTPVPAMRWSRWRRGCRSRR